MSRRLTTPTVVLDAAWIADAKNRARAILAVPPARDHIRRPKRKGVRVAQFVLPLALCPPQNRTRHGASWRLRKLKIGCLAAMQAQLQERRRAPLPGRPWVRCIRFSSVEPDKYNDGFKIPVDRLVEMGLLVDDKPTACELHQWWEPVRAKQGFGLVEVWTGETTAEPPRRARRGRAA